MQFFNFLHFELRMQIICIFYIGNAIFFIFCIGNCIPNHYWNQISGIRQKIKFWNYMYRIRWSNWFWNHMSGIRCPKLIFGIKRLDLVLESHVLELHVRIWFWKHVSWNHTSGIGFGITCLGITRPDWVLESRVLESHVRNWFWNHTSGIGFVITRPELVM